MINSMNYFLSALKKFMENYISYFSLSALKWFMRSGIYMIYFLSALKKFTLYDAMDFPSDLDHGYLCTVAVPIDF